MTHAAQERRILLADDDPFIVSLYRGKLTRAGFAVDVTRDGEETLRHLAEATPALLLLDLNMPRVDGVEVLRFVRERSAFRDLPVIVLSNACTQEMLEAVRPLNPTRFLTKRETTPNHVVEEILSLLGAAPADPTAAASPELTAASAAAPDAAERMQALQVLGAAGEEHARRDALLEFYRLVQDDLRRLRGADPLTAARQIGEAADQLFEDLYGRPSVLLPSTVRILKMLLRLLPSQGERRLRGAAEPVTVLVFSEDDGQRGRMRELCERPGLNPLAVRREATAIELMEGNGIVLAAWGVAKPGAARSTWKRLRADAVERRAGILFAMPADRMDRVENEEWDGRTLFVASPVLASEFRLSLFTLREGAGVSAGPAAEPG